MSYGGLSDEVITQLKPPTKRYKIILKNGQAYFVDLDAQDFDLMIRHIGINERFYHNIDKTFLINLGELAYVKLVGENE